MRSREENPAVAQTGRYATPDLPETAMQAGSRGRVHRNSKGITSRREMDQVEADAQVRAQDFFYSKLTSKTQFTARTILAMHREWLGELYVWAGKLRTVTPSKGGFTWPPGHLVPTLMRSLESEFLITRTPCRRDSIERVAENLAIVHAELLMVHPFVDGNGRLARWLADLMASQAGLGPLKYGLEGRGKKARIEKYIAAVRHGFVKDYRPLTGFFLEAIERTFASRP
jgi:cell filamentation protein